MKICTIKPQKIKSSRNTIILFSISLILFFPPSNKFSISLLMGKTIYKVLQVCGLWGEGLFGLIEKGISAE